MKKYISITIAAALFSCMSCSNWLELQPRNKVTEEIVLSSPEAIDAFAANLYGRIHIEDFNWSNREGFAWSNCWTCLESSGFCDECMMSQFDDKGPEFKDIWDDSWTVIRDINIFIQKNSSFNVSDEAKKIYLGEGHALRAFEYAALAKRYGGLPIITEPQQFTGNVEDLKVPRSTEYDTWKFIMNEFDLATQMLGTETSSRRFNKWSALGYKSRFALYAASIARFSVENGVSYAGQAWDKKLVGIDRGKADEFYRMVIDASSQIISSGLYGLYKPEPMNPDEAASNYQALFEDADACIVSPQEPIFCKGYDVNAGLGHNNDIFCRPNQLANGWKYPGRINPCLDLIDDYDDYTDDGLNNSGSMVLTTVGGVGDTDYNGYDGNKQYIKFDDPTQIFADKDARLRATCILPGSEYKNTKILIQGGIVKPDGTSVFRTSVDGGIEGKDGNRYYTFGAADKMAYSGFDSGSGNYSRSGFLLKKWLQEKNTVAPETNYGDNTWIDLRYAEILLNYAEAVAEVSSPTADEQSKAEEAINAIRRRAAHTDYLRFSGNLNNNRALVRNERRVELAFEHKRYWDLYRWRNFHLTYTSRILKSLVPYVDLRDDKPKYIFVRMYMPEFIGQSFYYNQYYRQIPGTGNSDLIQNP